jgi:Holliday junction resolvasome RuvABC DNA-binding subunit
MRDKLKKSVADLPLATTSPHDTLSSDAVSALINLGYPAVQAQKAVKKVLDSSKEKLELTELITATLRTL